MAETQPPEPTPVATLLSPPTSVLAPVVSAASLTAMASPVIGVGTATTEETLRRESFTGSIAAVFVLSGSPHLRYHAIVPRQSYLPLEWAPAATALGISIAWCAHKGVPLKWHLPIGVLFDSQADASALPWEVECFPRGAGPVPAVLLPDTSEAAVRSVFVNALKESVALRLGTTSLLLDLGVADMDQLWSGIAERNYDLYRQVVVRLRHEADMKGLPVRFVFRNEPVVGLPVSPDATLEEALRDVFGADSAVGAGEGLVTAQGVPVPRGAPLRFLWKNLMHPDNFLYLVIT